MIAPQRVVLSESATTTLKSLTQKTGLSANILARFAMLISFEMEDAVVLEAGKPGLTINRTTLFGELESFLMTAYSLNGRKSSEANVGKELASHIARGAAHLNLRTGQLSDFLTTILEFGAHERLIMRERN